MDIGILIDRAGVLKAQIQAKQAEFKAVSEELEKTFEFGDKKSLTVYGEAFKVTAQTKENYKWDQAKLGVLLDDIGDEEFQKFFDWEFKPKTMKEFDRVVELLPYKDKLKGCYVKSKGTTYLKFETLEG
jgi:hypothetical protein